MKTLKTQRDQVSQLPHSLEVQEIQHLHRAINTLPELLKEKPKPKPNVRVWSGRGLKDTDWIFPTLGQRNPGDTR